MVVDGWEASYNWRTLEASGNGSATMRASRQQVDSYSREEE